MHREKEPGARVKAWLGTLLALMDSVSLFCPAARDLSVQGRRAERRRERKLEEFGGSFWRALLKATLLLKTWGPSFLLEMMSSAPSVP